MISKTKANLNVGLIISPFATNPDERYRATMALLLKNLDNCRHNFHIEIKNNVLNVISPFLTMLSMVGCYDKITFEKKIIKTCLFHTVSYITLFSEFLDILH